MKKGSITVFLSLVLVLLFSFLLTTLEAARIRGARAYASMITELAGESFLASYYYPLFQNYRLFGVNEGDEDGFFLEDAMKEGIKEEVAYGLGELKGGLFRFQDTEVEVLEYETMLSNGEKEFLSQVRQQTVLDGLSLTLQELFSKDMFEEAGTVGEVYREQEEALEVTATVTRELLKLMERVDGIRMKDSGIAFDRYGKLQANSSFIKQLVPMEQAEIKASFDNAEVFRALSDKFYRADRAAGRVLQHLDKIAELDKKIQESKQRISDYQRSLAVLGEQLAAEIEWVSKQEKPDNTGVLALQRMIESVRTSLEQEQKKLEEYEEQRKSELSLAEGEYNAIDGKLRAVQSLLADSLTIVGRLEKKQKTASMVVGSYELFLNGVQKKLSEEIYQAFLKELEKMKFYAGLDERGFSVTTMRQSLAGNQNLLGDLTLKGFSEERLGEIAEEMTKIISRMDEYTVEGLWFPYGNIVVAEETWENVAGALGSLLTTGILSLVGVSKEEQSDSSLDGKDLPSAGLEQEGLLSELMDSIDKVREMFQNGGMGEVLEAAGNAFLDGTALELYGMKYFHNFMEQSPYTKLKYEREYLIFGAEKDKTNLLTMVLHLVAIRTLFCMVMLLKQPEKMSQLDMLSAGVVGFTGIPVLGAVVKYIVLLLWSVEEAFVEVSALLLGKRVAVVGVGTIALGELFRINKMVIAQKAKSLPESPGASYQDYLALLSLTKGTRKKAYRAMDLIQENIRYRYNDSFRIRNLVTQILFCTKSELKVLYDAGIFPNSAYEMECWEERAY